MTNPIVQITMQNGELIIIELYPEIAPITVANFINLVENKFYDGLIFHRVVPDFVIQGGDPTGLGQGYPGHTITGEFAANGIPNSLKHTRGVVSMARWSKYDSAGSQFFITLEATERLNGEYAAFGKVVQGMEHADTISLVERNYYDMPLEPVVMQSVRII